jgi:predicted MPP superfamily phosphohydrolase
LRTVWRDILYHFQIKLGSGQLAFSMYFSCSNAAFNQNKGGRNIKLASCGFPNFMENRLCKQPTKDTLRFNSNGSFKVLQLTDLHYENDETIISQNTEIINKLVAAESPDFLVFSGDIISGWKVKSERGSAFVSLYDKFASSLEDLAIPWAIILGNHDREGGLEPKEVLCLDSLYKSSRTLSTDLYNPENELDYILPIYRNDNSTQDSWIILMDSGRNTCKGEEWGGCVEEQQVKWLESTFVPLLHNNKTAIYFQHHRISLF